MGENGGRCTIFCHGAVGDHIADEDVLSSIERAQEILATGVVTLYIEKASKPC